MFLCICVRCCLLAAFSPPAESSPTYDPIYSNPQKNRPSSHTNALNPPLHSSPPLAHRAPPPMAQLLLIAEAAAAAR
jgi:hypothetical protein